MDILPKELINKAKDLRIIGIHELAWQYTDVLEALNVLYNNNHIILGEDVYRINNKKGILSTGDSWYFNKRNKEDDVNESYKKAIDYIEKYHNRNGEYFCYSLISDGIGVGYAPV